MAQPSKKMVVGFNHNINFQGKIYHVQTEDSGVDNPHVITHLFVGGNILASKRSSYRHLVGQIEGGEGLETQVRALMEAQHKEMLRNLKNGAFRDQEAQAASKAFQPGELAPGSTLGNGGAAARPSGTSPPTTLTEEGIGSIFAEDLISEKSLDEVILSYLAGEGDTK